MKLLFRSLLTFTVRLVVCLALLVCTLDLSQSSAETQPETERTFPGLDEVIPQSTAIAAKMTEADATINQLSSLETVYQQLADVSEKLQKLEKSFTNWDEAINWPLTRLMNSETRYDQINEQQKELLELVLQQLKDLEDLRIEWTEEKEYWQEWHKALRSSDASLPEETFTKTQKSIDELLKRISNASAQLIEKQQAFSPEQELITSRLNLIDTTLKRLRQETFRRNAYSLFSLDFYRQLTPELFSEYRNNIISATNLPEDFWQNHGWVIFLQIALAGVLAFILVQRKRQSKPISKDWNFLFQQPLSGAIFITLMITGALYEKMPESWGWALLVLGTITGTSLVVAMVEIPRQRRLIRAIAVLYLVSETLKITGLPDPVYQLYQVLLCVIITPMCLFLARRRQREQPGQIGRYRTSLYLISFFGALALITSLLGFATLSAHLIDAILGTIILFFLVRMAMHLADGGITAFLRLNQIKNRQFTKRLGSKTAERFKTLAHVFILVNAALFLPVLWNIFDDVEQVTTKLFSLEYTVGEFSISVYMVIMVLLVLYLTHLISWMLQALLDAHYMTPQSMDIGVKTAMKRLLHYALFTVGFFVAISMAGLDLQKFTIIAGALGVGIGFGLQNIVNNFVSGLILLFERPVKVGDIINIDNEWGTITNIGLRSTVFETLDRAEIIVPNSELISQKVTNWTFTTNVSRLTLSVGVAYGSPVEKVLGILMRAAKEHPETLEDPAPSAIFTAFGDSSLDFELRVWISDINKRLSVKSEIGQAVDYFFREEGISIPFPQRDLHLRSIDPDIKVPLSVQDRE